MSVSDKTDGSSAYDQTLVSHVTAKVGRTGSTQDDPLLGVELQGTYRVEQMIGEGGMGQLYRAAHLRLDRRFAVKVIHLPLSKREDMRVRFEREARLMSCVRSDHVVDVIDVVSTPDGRPCIVTELLEGQDLEQYLRSVGGKLTTQEAVVLLRQCLRGLSAAHALGVVHRDLKPGNLFLATGSSGDVTLKVLDFGVAKRGGDAELTATGVIVGTPAYMAPEQARGAPGVDARSDIYAAGAVLYRVLTGQSPYEGADANGTLIRLMEEAPARPSSLERSIPAGLEAIIEKAMARDPEQRFQNVDELDAALASFDSGARGILGRTSATTDATSFVSDPKTMTRRAKLTRPLAIVIALATSIVFGMSVAAGLALLVASLSQSPQLRIAELVLIGLGGGVAAIATAFSAFTAIQKAYRNVAMVQALTARFVRVGVVGCVSLAVLELSAVLWSTFGLLRPSADRPLWSATRVLLALLAAAAFAFFTKKKR
jgi:serine/threonine-protein kinase